MPSSFNLKQSPAGSNVGTISNGEYTNPAFESDNVALRNYANINPSLESYPVKPTKMEAEKLKPAENNKDEKKSEPALQPVPLLTLFRFADSWDKFFMFLGTLFSILNGMMIPFMILIFGNIIDAFSSNDLEQNFALLLNQTQSSTQDCGGSDLPNGGIVPTMRKFALYYVGIGILVTFFGWCQVTFWMLAAERQCHKIRITFLRSVLYQTIGWFDQRQSGELSTRLSDDVTKIQAGIGDKLGISIQWMAAGLASFVLGFIKGWQLSLVILSLCPLIGAGAYFMTKAVASLSNTESAAYAKAGAVAEEVLSNIRTVVAYSGEKKESIRYGKNLDSALKAGVKKSATTGFGAGFTFLVMFSSYCLGFWYGAKLIRDSEASWIGGCSDALAQGWSNATVYCTGHDATYTPGVMVTVFFSIIFGAFGLGQSFPNFALLAASRGLARTIFDIIDHASEIDASKNVGDRIDSGNSINIVFSNVKFSYPTRSDVEVLRGLDLELKVGETLALVGKSGCGKSTVVQLLQRFYDPSEGTVLMGENKLHSLNVRWLREQIGVVSQEPVLFATTIAENIRFGRPDVTEDEIEKAAKDANAHDFINKLPQKYDTLVGDRGAQLSGGQKQRVAIARALVRNPTLLILDEATSALDTESETIVQEALDKACQGRTTVIIAHRLSTIQNADKIAVIKDGAVVELGNHSVLMEKKGIYFRMVEAQRLGEDVDDDEDIDEAKEKSEKVNSARQRTLSVVSAQSMKNEKLDEILEKEKIPEVSLGRIIKMNSPEWFYIFLGCVAAGLNGAVQPMFAIIFASMLNIFGITDLEKQEKEALKYSLAFLLIGILVFIVNVLQALMFGISGEKLTKRLRHLSFEAMLRQEIAFFDEPRNGTGALTTRLASETSAVNGATGIRLGVIMQSIGSMGIGLILAFIYGWKMSLVILAFVPFIMLAGAAETKLMIGFSAESKKRLLEGGKVACEAIDNIRTVVSLGREREFLNAYIEKITPAHKKEINKAIIYGAAFGLAQGIIYFAYSAAFYFGATQVQSCEMTFDDVMKVVGCIIFSAMAVGQAASFAPDYGKAKAAANEIFALLDRKPLIDYSSSDGIQLENVSGNVTFSNVDFRYPSRPDVDVLSNMNFNIVAGQTLALVGSSGCGKSTCIQLLERFYDTLNGKVMLENVDVKALSISWMRAQFGLVSQEPVLFDCTVAENIAYGDNSRIIPMAEIIDAARQANVHEFISSLPNGYETRVGEKGGQMSGGQKQRIAIARALVRRPKILLLDEATSALDSESEKIVQAALDAARLERTCIVIAHRLSTIQNADAIAVVQAGHIAEYGTHNELINRQGLYFRLCKAQSRV